MIDTILFDLDGTLLPMDLDEFLEKYFFEVGQALKHKINPELLKKYIYKGTMAMLGNMGYDTNENIFMKTFAQFVGEKYLPEYRAALNDFYDNGFVKTRSVVKKVGKIPEDIKTLKEKGYTLAVATNPIFPLKAIIQRIQWAGLSPDDFSYISSFEINTYTKPSKYFYKEVIDAIGRKPEQCMMVGNDVQDDMSAAELGMDTFLIKDFLINRGDEKIKCTYQGCYQDFNNWVQSLEPLVKSAK